MTCGCGCGQITPINKVNHRAKGRIKGQHCQFILGHSLRTRKSYRVDAKCVQCGADFQADRWSVEHGEGRFCSVSCAVSARSGTGKGPYIGRPYQHVRIAESVLGKRLPVGAEVHHVNGNGRDNRNQNLVICQDRRYHKLLHMRQRIRDAGGNPNTDRVCSRCESVKPSGEFGKGNRGWCLQCGREYSRLYSQKEKTHGL